MADPGGGVVILHPLKNCAIIKADCVQFSGAGANEVMEGFEQMKGFPRVIGAVDGCHIQIKTPQDAYHPMSYLKKKEGLFCNLAGMFQKDNKK